jgi:hypothetical protein
MRFSRASATSMPPPRIANLPRLPAAVGLDNSDDLTTSGAEVRRECRGTSRLSRGPLDRASDITRRLGAIAAPRNGLGAMPDGGECRIAAMSDEIDVSLFCPAQHHVGNLVKFSTQIAYHPIGGKLAAWPPHQADMWWEVSCPEGCPGAFGGAVDPIRQEVDRLAADPKRTNAHYTLKRVG